MCYNAISEIALASGFKHCNVVPSRGFGEFQGHRERSRLIYYNAISDTTLEWILYGDFVKLEVIANAI